MLCTLPDASVHCVVTSPPYYGLRDYGTAQWDGGDVACDHARGLVPVAADDPGIRCSTLDGGKRTTTAQAEARSYRDICGKCGARRIDRQIGLEATPDEYLQTMVEVFRLVRRVLRDDGTVFCNMGDGYQDKQLLMMPARLALALQADGWWLRSDIIWAKPNPMPESVTDRPTSAHEHVFLLTKSARYFYDADGVREEAASGMDLGLLRGRAQSSDPNVSWCAAYTEMAMERCRRDAPLFADLAPVPSEDAYDRDMRDLFEEAAD